MAKLARPGNQESRTFLQPGNKYIGLSLKNFSQF